MLNPFLETTVAKDRIAKMEEMFPGTEEPKKKSPPIEGPLTEISAETVAKNNAGLTFSETTTEIQKPIPMRRKLDPELKAMDAIAETLEGLTEQQRWRVINWCLSRFMVENNGNLPKTAYKVPSAAFDAEVIKAVAAGRAEFLPPG